MPRYSEERRQAVVAKLLPPYPLSAYEVAEQEDISIATLYKWRKEARAEGRCLPNASDQGVKGWSSQDKFAAVVESASLNGEQIAQYCRRRGLFPEQLQQWRHDCEQAASLSHDDRRRDATQTKAQRRRIRDLERELKRKDAALAETAALLTLSKKARAIWGARSHDQYPRSPTRRRADPTSPDLRGSPEARLRRAGYYRAYAPALDPRWRPREDRRPLAERPVPRHALTATERQEILDVCHRPAFADLPPDQIVVRLLDDEQRYLASVSSFYRVLRRHGEVVHRGRARKPKRVAAPTTYRATAPNQVWSWDCTWLPGPARGTYYYLVMILDIYSRKIVGWEVFLAESAHNSRTVIERAVLAEQVIDQPLVLHADNGSPFKGATLLEKLRELNIESSFSRPRVSNDNAFSEALFRTCKYVPNYPVNGFAQVAKARQWVQGFVDWYNQAHRHSGIRFVTPAQRHAGEEAAILSRRHALYQEARDHNPARWSGKTRNWDPIPAVSLNPERESNVTPDQPEQHAA